MKKLIIAVALFSAAAPLFSNPQTAAPIAEISNPLTLGAALAKDRIPAGIVIAGEESNYTTRQSLLAVIVEPRRATVCDDVLRRPLPPQTLTLPAHEAFWRLASFVNPNGVPAAPPGVVCGGNCKPDEQPSHLKAVTLSLAGMTLEDGLSQIVHGAPGLVWVLHEQWTEHRQERTCTFEFFSNEQRVQTSYVLASAPGKL